MFLIFHELRADVLPVDDIGLQRAIALHYHGGERLHAGRDPRARDPLAAVPERRDLVPVALARPDSGRVLTASGRHRERRGCRPDPAANATARRCLDDLPASLRRPHARPRARRARERRPARRRPPARAQQLREPRLPGRHGGRPAGRGEVLPPGALDRRADPRRARASSPELAEREIPVVAPLALRRARRCTRFGGFRFAVYPRRGGRAPELDDPRHAGMDGALHRPHPRGRRAAAVRASGPALDIESFGDEPRDWLLAHDFIPRRPARRPGRSVVDAGARRRAPLLRARRRRAHAPPARRLPRRQRAVDRRRPALRRFRRQPHGAGGAGPVDAALRRPRRR